MDWLENLFFGVGIAHGIFAFALVITIGVLLGRVKVAGISLGITWILFVGIAFGHFGMGIEPNVLHLELEWNRKLSISLRNSDWFYSFFR